MIIYIDNMSLKFEKELKMIDNTDSYREESNEEKANEEMLKLEVYSYVKELSLLKYKSEIDRTESLMKQSSNMQTAFVFMTAAIFMIAPVLLKYCNRVSKEFFFIAISSIVFFLLLSLLFSSLVQIRRKTIYLAKIEELEKDAKNKWKKLKNRSFQMKQFIDALAKIVDCEEKNPFDDEDNDDGIPVVVKRKSIHENFEKSIKHDSNTSDEESSEKTKR